MSKPMIPVKITTVEGKDVSVRAVLDTGSFYTLIRQDLLPPGTPLIRYSSPEVLRAAARGSRLTVVGTTELIMEVGSKRIRDHAGVCPELASELLIGAKTMQSWDVTIANRNGRTKITVGHDMRDPEITEVD
jgi:phenylacetate-coenzyme A ligase PaaK-like adenylate-forming protein